jgi:heme exporter protein CcmD
VSHFLAMGGYAGFLWPAYGLTLLAVVLNVVWARRLLARAKLDARRRLEMQGGSK